MESITAIFQSRLDRLFDAICLVHLIHVKCQRKWRHQWRNDVIRWRHTERKWRIISGERTYLFLWSHDHMGSHVVLLDLRWPHRYLVSTNRMSVWRLIRHDYQQQQNWTFQQWCNSGVKVGQIDSKCNKSGAFQMLQEPKCTEKSWTFGANRTYLGHNLTSLYSTDHWVQFVEVYLILPNVQLCV